MRGAGHPAGERREYRYRRDACRRHGRGRAIAGEGGGHCGAPHLDLRHVAMTSAPLAPGLRSVGSAPGRVNIYERK